MAEHADVSALDTVALDLIIENLVKLCCETHGEDAGLSMLGGMYLAVLLMEDPDLAPIARQVLRLNPERQPRILATYEMIRGNLVGPPGLPTTTEADECDGTLLDGPW